MVLRSLWLIWLLSVLGFTGCKKSADTDQQGAGNRQTNSVPTVPKAEIIGRLHWLGKIRLGTETNAAGFMSIWNLAESTNLEAQTITKLSTAPWRLLKGAPPLSNAPANLLLPLINDLVAQESYLELEQTGEQPGSLALAVKLEQGRAAAWRTNLAAVVENLTGIKPEDRATNSGWVVHKHDAPNQIELVQTGDWTLLGLGQESNAVLQRLIQRIQEKTGPFESTGTNYWVDANLDLKRISTAFGLGWRLPADWPKVSLSMIGTGENVRTLGSLKFPHALPDPEPWNIPTNLIHDPLVSFTAVQCIRPWVSNSAIWKKVGSGEAPNQAFVWAQALVPFFDYSAIQIRDAENTFRRLSDMFTTEGNAWLTTNGLGSVLQGTNSLVWSDLPLVSPFLRIEDRGEQKYLFGGLILPVNTNKPMPAELLDQLESSRDIMAYDWEMTGPRLEQWLNFGQLLRFALGKAQLPAESQSFKWLRALEDRLSNSGTTVTRSSPTELSLRRNSGIGLTSAELVWLADWLESPDFPTGLNTWRGKPVPLDVLKRPHRRSTSTNSPAAPQ